MRIFSIGCFFLIQTLALFAQKACIEGDVVDTNGAPISGIHVIGVHTQALVSFDGPSDGEGHFRFDTLPPGGYAVATTDEYGADSSRINSRSMKIVNLVKVTAKEDGCSSVTLREPVRARIRFTATDLLTAAPILSASATFRYDEDSAWNGGYSNKQHLLLIPPFADLQVQAGATGYEDSEVLKIPAMQPGEEREIKVALRPLQTGCIDGQVIDQSGTPVSDVDIQPQLMEDRLASPPRRKRTDKNGQFQLDHAQPGHYILFANADAEGYPFSNDRELNTVEVQPGMGCSNITINIGPKAAKLEIKILDAFTHQTLKNFKASVSNGIPSNEGGWTLFFFKNPLPVAPMTSMKVWAEADGYQSAERIIVGPLLPEENKQITIELYPLASAHKKD
jgi:hypothetical protein